MDPDRLARINSGYLPPVIIAEGNIFIDKLEIEMKNTIQQGEIKYTMDGTDPGAESPVYSGPVNIVESTTIKARTYWSDDNYSSVTERSFEKAIIRRGISKEGLEPGLSWQYFENDSDEEWKQIPDFEGLESSAKGVVGQCTLEPAGRDEEFAIRFEGYVSVPVDGIYTFYSNSDDGTKLFIDDELVVDNDFQHGMAEIPGQIALGAGIFPFRLEFYQGKGSKGLEIKYEGPGLEKQIIPEGAFYH